LSEVTNKIIYAEEFNCFVTTGHMCPYNGEENWFMASFWHSIPFSITTICHEVLHMQFLYYYRSFLKKKRLSNGQVEDIKEATTFLLNEPEFKEIILNRDIGYPNHQVLRKKLKREWVKNRDFEKLLDKAVELVKNK